MGQTVIIKKKKPGEKPAKGVKIQRRRKRRKKK